MQESSQGCSQPSQHNHQLRFPDDNNKDNTSNNKNNNPGKSNSNNNTGSDKLGSTRRDEALCVRNQFAQSIFEELILQQYLYMSWHVYTLYQDYLFKEKEVFPSTIARKEPVAWRSWSL